MKFFIFVVLFVLIGIIAPVYVFNGTKSSLHLPAVSLERWLPTPHLEAPPPEAVAPGAKNVKLFYYNSSRDKSGNGSLSYIERPLPDSPAPIKSTLTLLLTQKLTRPEKDAGFSSELPHPGFVLKSTKLDKGTLTLILEDKDNFTCGGSYRIDILKKQITQTALQFPGVKEVVILPDTLFQP